MGWTYNTANPNAETNAPTIAAVGITFTTVSLLAVCLRMYVRLFLIKAVGIDDWTIVFTWPCAFGFMVLTLLQTKWGLGLQHLSDMPDENIFNFGLLQYCGAPFYIASILGFKLSLLFSFLRIAVEKKYKYAIMGIMAACTAFNLSFLLIQLNLCTPVAKQWDPKITTGHCLVAVPFYTSMASLTIIFDVIVIFTPFPMLLKSCIPSKKKLVLLGIFSLGTFITVIQVIRILTIKSLTNYIDSSQLIMWSMVENNLGIIVTCIPPLSPLVRSFRERSSNASRARDQGRASGYNLQSSKASKNGLVELGGESNGSLESPNVFGSTVVGGGKTANSSEEFILDSSIRKTTHVTVSHGGLISGT